MYKFLIMIRHYGLDFHSIAGNGFSQNSVLQNEQGIYWASQIVVGRSMEWELFADLFRINWLKYQLDKPEPQLHLGVFMVISEISLAHHTISLQNKIEESENLILR